MKNSTNEKNDSKDIGNDRGKKHVEQEPRHSETTAAIVANEPTFRTRLAFDCRDDGASLRTLALAGTCGQTRNKAKRAVDEDTGKHMRREIRTAVSCSTSRGFAYRSFSLSREICFNLDKACEGSDIVRHARAGDSPEEYLTLCSLSAALFAVLRNNLKNHLYVLHLGSLALTKEHRRPATFFVVFLCDPAQELVPQQAE